MQQQAMLLKPWKDMASIDRSHHGRTSSAGQCPHTLMCLGMSTALQGGYVPEIRFATLQYCVNGKCMTQLHEYLLIPFGLVTLLSSTATSAAHTSNCAFPQVKRHTQCDALTGISFQIAYMYCKICFYPLVLGTAS